jgi:hypothetical protein
VGDGDHGFDQRDASGAACSRCCTADVEQLFLI